MFASLTEGGIFVSKDHGDSWESIQGNMYNEVLVNNFYNLNGNIFAGTSHHGLWKANFSDILSTSHEEKTSPGMQVYPNPAISHINISGLDEKSTVYIYNTSGQLVKTNKGATNIDITGLPTGLYLAKIEGSGDTKSVKFTKR